MKNSIFKILVDIILTLKGCELPNVKIYKQVMFTKKFNKIKTILYVCYSSLHDLLIKMKTH